MNLYFMKRYRSYRFWLGLTLCSLAFQIAPILYEENNSCVTCETGIVIAMIERGGQSVIVRSELLELWEKLCR